MSKSIKEVMDLIKNNKEMQKQYQEDPVNFLESNDVDTNNLPEEYLEKIAGGFFGADLNTNFDTNVHTGDDINNTNHGSGNTIISGSTINNGK